MSIPHYDQQASVDTRFGSHQVYINSSLSMHVPSLSIDFELHIPLLGIVAAWAIHT